MTACSESCPSSWAHPCSDPTDLTALLHMREPQAVPALLTASQLQSTTNASLFFIFCALFGGRNDYFFLKLWLNAALHQKHLGEHRWYRRGWAGPGRKAQTAQWAEACTACREANKCICMLGKWIKCRKHTKPALAHTHTHTLQGICSK